MAENLYKFNVCGSKKLVCEFSDKGFSDKGWNVKSLNNLLKKLQASGLMTRGTESGRRRRMHFDASLGFTRYSINIYKKSELMLMRRATASV